MAAPICTFCGRIQRNLQRVTGTKRAYEKDIEKILTDALCLQISFTFACKICVPCLTLCEKFCEFKRKVKGNTELLNSLAISPALMSPSTPKGPTPKRRRMITPLKSIAEVKPTEKKVSSRRSIDFAHDHGYSLQTEVESVGETLAKKIHSNSTPRKSVAEKIHSNLTPRKSVAEWLKETCNPGYSLQNEESVGETLAKKIHSNSTPRKSVAEKIHGNLTPRKSVAEWLKETLSKVDESNEEQKVKKEIIIHHLAALQKLAFNGASVLFKKSPSVLCDSTLSEIVDEMKNHLPFLYSLLNVMIGVSGSKTGTIALIYAMILHSRNKQASRMQRIMSTFLMSCNASNMLMTRLNKFHLTLSGDSKVNLIKDYANYNEHLVIKAVAAGEDGKLNGDNLDIFVTTNDIRMTNHNKDYHFFATDWTPYRVKQQDFNEHAGVQEAIDRTIDLEPTTENFLVSDNENKKFVHYLAQLLGREMSKTCTNFKWLESVVPKHIEHSLSDIMSRKTVSYRLPILLKNEAKYDDCIQIMESYVTMVTDWYNKASRGLAIS